MDYNNIISYIVAVIFGWLFISSNAAIELTKTEKRPFSYVFSLWLCAILSTTGLVLSLYNHLLAVAFTPYLLIGCAILHTSVIHYYLQKSERAELPNWIYTKSRVYVNLFYSTLVLVFVFLGLGIKEAVVKSTGDFKVVQKIDSLGVKVDENKETTIKTADTLKKEIERNRIGIKATNDKINTITKKDKEETKILVKTSKTASAIKKDTEQLKKTQTLSKPVVKEKKKFLGIF